MCPDEAFGTFAALLLLETVLLAVLLPLVSLELHAASERVASIAAADN
jgi:hypothetical protein